MSDDITTPMSLVIGDVIYTVDEKRTWRNKIWKIDSDGIKWFRYDKDLVEYNLNELTLIGRITPTIEGIYRNECGDEFLTYVETIFSSPNGKIFTFADEIDNAYFILEDAETYISEEREKNESN